MQADNEAPLTPGVPLSVPRWALGSSKAGPVSSRPAYTSGARPHPWTLGGRFSRRAESWPRPVCPLAAAPGGPAVCLPAPVTRLFVLLPSGAEESESMASDSFVKSSFIETRFPCRTVRSERNVCRAAFPACAHACAPPPRAVLHCFSPPGRRPHPRQLSPLSLLPPPPPPPALKRHCPLSASTQLPFRTRHVTEPSDVCPCGPASSLSAAFPRLVCVTDGL